MMKITTFGVCVSGYERLRSQDEFILVTDITAASTAEEIRAGFMADIQRCERAVDFDHKAARALVDAFFHETLQPAFFRQPNPFGPVPDEDNESTVTAFLYVQESSNDQG